MIRPAHKPQRWKLCDLCLDLTALDSWAETKVSNVPFFDGGSETAHRFQCPSSQKIPRQDLQGRQKVAMRVQPALIDSTSATNFEWLPCQMNVLRRLIY